MFLDKEVDVSKAEGLFKEVKYYVTGEICEKVQQLLSTGEAKKTSYLSGLNTHCIVGSQPDMNEVSLSLSVSLWHEDTAQGKKCPFGCLELVLNSIRELA